MKRFLIICFLLATVVVAKSQESELADEVKRFHKAMIFDKNAAIEFIHPQLTYGHSNGWIETAEEFRKNLGSYIIYHQISEDSMQVNLSGNKAHVRFVAEIQATLNNAPKATFRLKVLEVWTKEEKGWKIFARQAVKG